MQASLRGGLASTSAPSLQYTLRFPCCRSRRALIVRNTSNEPGAPGPSKKTGPSAEDLQARIRKAREYKGSSNNAENTAAPKKEISETPAGVWQTSQDREGLGLEGINTAGSASEVASFLKGTVKEGADEADKGSSMSAEQFTLKKEIERKQIQVEIISVDNTYKPTREGVGEQYQPKVSTWGVFPRPENISKAFGGGRTIKPGAPLESEEARQARNARVAEALEKYKKQSGLIVDPVKEAKAQELFDAASALFENGALSAALAKYSEAAELVPVRSKLGGQALLQQAICLDSLARSQEAFTIYKKIERHPTPLVAKRAKQMLFGFTAMDNLKTHTISYSVSKGAYSKYFRKLEGQFDNVYFSGKDAPPTDNRLDAIIATSVMLAPLVLLGVKILKL